MKPFRTVKFHSHSLLCIIFIESRHTVFKLDMETGSPVSDTDESEIVKQRSIAGGHADIGIICEAVRAAIPIDRIAVYYALGIAISIL